MLDDAAMAPVPHPTGSPANARVRDYLIARMTALGLSPRVQRAESHRDRSYGGETYVSGADVENIIGVLPGRNRSLPALTLMAHYDSACSDLRAPPTISLEWRRFLKSSGPSSAALAA